MIPRRWLLGLLAVAAAGCRTRVQHGLEERDANEVASVLSARGFEPEKVPEHAKKPTWAIEVDDDRAMDAMRLLAELRLPRVRGLTTKDVVAESGLIETPAAERLKQFEALEGDLEQSLETMDGVTAAAIELAAPSAPRPGLPAGPAKASVLLRALPDAAERLHRRRAELQAWVAGSVEGLRGEDVVLVIDAVVTATPAIGAPAGRQLRPLLGGAGLGLGLSILGAGLAFGIVQRRRRRALPPGMPAVTVPLSAAQALPPPGPVPVISSAIVRKGA